MYMSKKAQVDIGALLVAIFTSVWLYVGIVTALITGFGMKYLRKTGLSRNLLMVVGIAGIVISIFGVGFLSVGSVGDLDAKVVRLHTTTAYVVTNTTGATVADTGSDTNKASKFYISEGFINGDATIDTGVMQVYRGGRLDPVSCEVCVLRPPTYTISNTQYQLVNEDSSTNILTAYVYTGSTTGTANGDEPKECNSLAFDRGVDTGFVAFNISLDETGIDPLTQYHSKFVHLDICGYPYAMEVVKSDA